MHEPVELDQSLAAPVWASASDLPSHHATEILPGLFMGGTADDDTVADPAPLRYGVSVRPYDAVVTLYAWAQPMSWGVEELRYGFGDGQLHGHDIAKVIGLSEWAYSRRVAGQRVLIRCQAGLNRSGLVTALVLIRAGWDPAAAIRHLRATRSPYALGNRAFVSWLVHDGAAAVDFRRHVS